MNIALTRIILFCQNVALLKNFYQRHFNFEVTQEIAIEWVVMKAGQMEITFHKIGDSFTDDINLLRQTVIQNWFLK